MRCVLDSKTKAIPPSHTRRDEKTESKMKPSGSAFIGKGVAEQGRVTWCV